MKILKALLTAFLVAPWTAVGTNATPMTASFSGSAYGTDGAGLFGTAGAVYWGESFSGVVKFDSSLGQLIGGPPGITKIGGTSSSLATAASSPIQSASVTLAGHTVSFDTSYLSQVQIGDPSDHLLSAVVWGSPPENWVFYIHGLGGPPATDPSGAYDIFVGIGRVYNAGFSTDLGLNAPIIHIAPFSPTTKVPEPLSISLFLMGLTGVVFMRRKRKTSLGAS